MCGNIISKTNWITRNEKKEKNQLSRRCYLSVWVCVCVCDTKLRNILALALSLSRIYTHTPIRFVPPEFSHVLTLIRSEMSTQRIFSMLLRTKPSIFLWISLAELWISGTRFKSVPPSQHWTNRSLIVHQFLFPYMVFDSSKSHHMKFVVSLKSLQQILSILFKAQRNTVYSIDFRIPPQIGAFFPPFFANLFNIFVFILLTVY